MVVCELEGARKGKRVRACDARALDCPWVVAVA